MIRVVKCLFSIRLFISLLERSLQSPPNFAMRLFTSKVSLQLKHSHTTRSDRRWREKGEKANMFSILRAFMIHTWRRTHHTAKREILMCVNVARAASLHPKPSPSTVASSNTIRRWFNDELRFEWRETRRNLKINLFNEVMTVAKWICTLNEVFLFALSSCNCIERFFAPKLDSMLSLAGDNFLRLKTISKTSRKSF